MERSGDPAIDMAQALLRDGQHAQALPLILTALESDPSNALLLKFGSDAHRLGRDWHGSLERAHALICHHPDAWHGYGRAAQDRLALGQTEAAVAILRRGLARLPKDAMLLTIGLEVEQRANNADAALALGERLIAHDPSNWRGYVRSAHTQLALHASPQAEALLARALERFPGDREVLSAAVAILRSCDKRQASLTVAQELIHHHPRYWLGYHLAAKLRLSLGGFEEARLYNRMAQRLAPARCKRQTARIGRQIEALLCTSPTPLQSLWQQSLQTGRERGQPGAKAAERSRTWQPFQYWSQGVPPPEVQIIHHHWNSLLRDSGLAPIQLYDRASARCWLQEHAPALLRPFASAFHYALEADVFRIAYACHRDCIWIDGDLFPKRAAQMLLCDRMQATDTLLLFRSTEAQIGNCFFATRAGSPFFLRLAETLEGRDLSAVPRDIRTVLATAGPVLYTKIFGDLAATATGRPGRPGQTAACNVAGWRYGFLNEEFFALNGRRFQLAYKQGDQSWQMFVRQRSENAAATHRTNNQPAL